MVLGVWGFRGGDCPGPQCKGWEGLVYHIILQCESLLEPHMAAATGFAPLQNLQIHQKASHRKAVNPNTEAGSGSGHALFSGSQPSSLNSQKASSEPTWRSEPRSALSAASRSHGNDRRLGVCVHAELDEHVAGGLLMMPRCCTNR